MHNDWSCSVQPVVGRETPMDMETYQVTEASSDALHEIYDGLSSLPTMTFSDMIMPSARKDIENDEIITSRKGLHNIYPKGSNLLSQQSHPYTGMMRW